MQKPTHTVKINMQTAKATGRKGGISGKSLSGEVDITVEGPFDPEESKNDPELLQSCLEIIRQNPAMAGKGIIVSAEIVEIVTL